MAKQSVGQMYTVTLSDEAKAGIAKLKKSEPASFKKAVKLLNELMDQPYTGTGHPHRLTGDRSGQWSRSIGKKHRIVYEIHDDIIEVYVLSSYGHYDDK